MFLLLSALNRSLGSTHCSGVITPLPFTCPFTISWAIIEGGTPVSHDPAGMLCFLLLNVWQ